MLTYCAICGIIIMEWLKRYHSGDKSPWGSPERVAGVVIFFRATLSVLVKLAKFALKRILYQVV